MFDMRWMLLLCIIMFICSSSFPASFFADGAPASIHHIIPSTYISWAMAATCCMQLACRPALELRFQYFTAMKTQVGKGKMKVKKKKGEVVLSCTCTS
jgi:hypothetical protein